MELVVHRGSVIFEIPTEPGSRELIDQIFENQEEIKLALLVERGADVSNLIELWKSDRELRRQFPNFCDFDDHAHRSGIRLLRSAEPIQQKFR